MPVRRHPRLWNGVTLSVVHWRCRKWGSPSFSRGFDRCDAIGLPARSRSSCVALASYQSKFDDAFIGAGPRGPNLAVLTPSEQLGQQLFTARSVRAQCHATNAKVSDDIHKMTSAATLVSAADASRRRRFVTWVCALPTCTTDD